MNTKNLFKSLPQDVLAMRWFPGKTTPEKATEFGIKERKMKVGPPIAYARGPDGKQFDLIEGHWLVVWRDGSREQYAPADFHKQFEAPL